jgi:hypothetical protein
VQDAMANHHELRFQGAPWPFVTREASVAQRCGNCPGDKDQILSGPKPRSTGSWQKRTARQPHPFCRSRQNQEPALLSHASTNELFSTAGGGFRNRHPVWRTLLATQPTLLCTTGAGCSEADVWEVVPSGLLRSVGEIDGGGCAQPRLARNILDAEEAFQGRTFPGGEAPGH